MSNIELDRLQDNIRNKITESVLLTKKTQEVLGQKKGNFEGQLRECNQLKNDLLELYRQILGEYNTLLEKNMDTKSLRLTYTYVEGVRVHLSMQQDDCNQLQYQVQLNQYKYSMCWTYVAVGVTVVFSAVSIVLTLFPCLL